MNQVQRQAIERLELFTLYLTPFAIILVSLGLIFGEDSSHLFGILIALLVVTSSFNIGTLFYLKKNPSQMDFVGKLRLGFNYAFNIVFVYLLTPYWTHVWMLFLLTLIPISLLESQKNTILHTVIMSLVLLAVYYEHNLLQGVRLGEFVLYVLFLNMISCVIYKLLDLYRKNSKI